VWGQAPADTRRRRKRKPRCRALMHSWLPGKSKAKADDPLLIRLGQLTRPLSRHETRVASAPLIDQSSAVLSSTVLPE
jgi:hypothetical protein